MGQIVAIVNQKGGVGKTTTAVNLAASLAAIDKSVLIVDFDPQGNATSGVNVDKDSVVHNVYTLLAGESQLEEAVVQCELPTLHIVPGTRNLAAAEVELVGEEQREYVLKHILRPHRDTYDYIFVDCPPSLSLLTINALTAADGVIIPIQAEYYALEGVRDLMNTIQLVKSGLNPQLEITGVLITMFDERTNLSQQVLNDVKTYFGDSLYQTIVPRNVRLSEAPSFGKPAMLHDIKSKGAQAYLKLAKEFLNAEKVGAR